MTRWPSRKSFPPQQLALRRAEPFCLSGRPIQHRRPGAGRGPFINRSSGGTVGPGLRRDDDFAVIGFALPRGADLPRADIEVEVVVMVSVAVRGQHDGEILA